MILSTGSKKDKQRELMLAMIMNNAARLAEMDDTTSSQVLRALAHTIEQRVKEEFNLCTHGCDVTLPCQFQIGRLCKQKSIRCEKYGGLRHDSEGPSETDAGETTT